MHGENQKLKYISCVCLV